MKKLFTLACSVLLLTGCVTQTNAPVENNVFHLNLGTEPPDLDPAKMNDLTSYTVVMALMKGLTQYDEHLKPVPAIAESWTRSPDGKHYEFHLRKDARWSDGKSVTAQDFVYAWERSLSPEMASDYAIFLFELKNGKTFFEGKLKNFSEVGVKAIDAHTLTVDLERPTPFFFFFFAAPVAMPVRKDMVDRYGDTWTEAGHYLSNAPF